jgi:hypothetical protein
MRRKVEKEKKEKIEVGRFREIEEYVDGRRRETEEDDGGKAKWE